MIKIPLSKTEIKTLISLLLNADYDGFDDIFIRELVGYIIRRVLKRLDNKLQSFPTKKKVAQMGFKPAELSAIHKTIPYCYRNDIYDNVLIIKISSIINQKVA